MSILRDDCLPRIPFEEPVTLEVVETGAVLSCRGLNLSCGGMFVCNEEALPEGTPVRLGFSVPGGRPLSVDATVLRVVQPDDHREPPGMALRFDDLLPSTLRDIDSYLARWLQPADDHRVRLELGEPGLAISARPQTCFGNFISVSADLPFLRVGGPVRLLDAAGAAGESGTIRWVSVQVPPGSGVPRLHIGIEVGASAPAESVEPDRDPVCCTEFVDDATSLDSRLRAERRQANA